MEESEHEAEMDLDVKDQEEFDNLWAVKALNLVHGERAQQYGHPYDVYTKARVMWLAILGVNITWTQFCYCLAALKMSRELTTPHPTDDNNVDIIGYIAVLNRIILKEVEIANSGLADKASGVGEQELPAPAGVPATAGTGGGSGRAVPRSTKRRAGNSRPRSRSRKN